MAPARAVLAARQAVRAVLTDCSPGERVLVACSGGSDSLALALAVAAETRRSAISAEAITVDHGILDGSDQRALELVTRLSDYLPTVAVQVNVEGLEGPEGNARTARYGAIASRARELGGPALVLLGHTRDDQAETVLLGLGRGSGPRSIAGMKPTGTLPGADDVHFVRPFLGLDRHTLRRACSEWGEQWWDDPSNSVDGPWRTAGGAPLRRAAVRERAIPALSEAVGQDVRGPLARTAHLLQTDLDYLDGVAREALASASATGAGRTGDVDGSAGDSYELDVEWLRAQHPAIRTRVIRLWLIAGGARAGELTSWHVDSVENLLHGETGKGIDVPGLRAVRTRHGLKRAVE